MGPLEGKPRNPTPIFRLAYAETTQNDTLSYVDGAYQLGVVLRPRTSSIAMGAKKLIQRQELEQRGCIEMLSTAPEGFVAYQVAKREANEGKLQFTGSKSRNLDTPTHTHTGAHAFVSPTWRISSTTFPPGVENLDEMLADLKYSQESASMPIMLMFFC